MLPLELELLCRRLELLSRPSSSSKVWLPQDRVRVVARARAAVRANFVSLLFIGLSPF